MALQISYTDKSGFTAPQAYCRVSEINGNWQKKQARIKIPVFKDQDARNNGLEPMAVIKKAIHEQNGWDDALDFAVLNQTNTNPVREVYLWLKDEPEFANSVDV